MAARNDSRGTRRRGRFGDHRPRTHPSKPVPKGGRKKANPKLLRNRSKRFPDLHAILGRFNDALALIVVAHRAKEFDFEAAAVLAHGITALNAVYGRWP